MIKTGRRARDKETASRRFCILNLLRKAVTVLLIRFIVGIYPFSGAARLSVASPGASPVTLFIVILRKRIVNIVHI